MKKWLAGCAVLLLLVAAVAAGLGYLAYVEVNQWRVNRQARRRAEQAAIDAGIAQRRRYLEQNLTDETRATIPPEFYTYDGFRDWWRVPLVYPFQLVFIDTFDSAGVGAHDPDSPVAAAEFSLFCSDITRLATDHAVLVYEETTDRGTSYGMLQYVSGIHSRFDDEQPMWAAAREAGFSGNEAFLTAKDYYDAYYDFERDFVGQPLGDFR